MSGMSKTCHAQTALKHVTHLAGFHHFFLPLQHIRNMHAGCVTSCSWTWPWR
jgi:hypothetical protein